MSTSQRNKAYRSPRLKAIIAIATFMVLAAGIIGFIYWWAYYWVPWADALVNRAFGL